MTLRKITAILVNICLFSEVAFAHQTGANLWEDRILSRHNKPSFRQSLSVDMASFHQRLQEIQNNRASDKTRQAWIATLIGAFGTVRKVVTPPTAVPKGTILHIQDVHLNHEAQENIGKALTKLLVEDRVGLIALEGAFGPINLSNFQKYPDRAAVKRLADYFLREKKIPGAIHAALTSTNARARIVGVDDRLRYDANVAAYKESAPRVKKEKEAVLSRQNDIEKSKRSTFNPALMRFDDAVRAHRDGRLNLGGYLKQLSTPLLPQSRAFRDAFEMERALDFNQVDKERKQFLAAAEPNELPSAAKYPTLAAYLSYVALAQSVDAEELFREVRESERDTYAALAKTETEKSLITRSRYAYLTNRLLDFGLTREEWAEYTVVPTKAGTQVSNLSQKNVYDLDSRFCGKDGLSSFEDFYRHAEARDNAMAKNFLSSAGGKAALSVLVTGGFHSAGLDRALSEAGYTVVRFTPKISKIESSGGTTYLGAFNQEKTPLEKLFEGPKLFLTQEVYPAAIDVKLRTGLELDRQIADGDGEAWKILQGHRENVKLALSEEKGRVVSFTEETLLPLFPFFYEDNDTLTLLDTLAAGQKHYEKKLNDGSFDPFGRYEDRRRVEKWFAPDYEFLASLRWDFFSGHKNKTWLRAVGVLVVWAATAFSPFLISSVVSNPTWVLGLTSYAHLSLTATIFLANVLPPSRRQLPWILKLLLAPTYAPNWFSHTAWNIILPFAALTISASAGEIRALLENTPYLPTPLDQQPAKERKITESYPPPTAKIISGGSSIEQYEWVDETNTLITAEADKVSIYFFKDNELADTAVFDGVSNYKLSAKHRGIKLKRADEWEEYLIGRNRRLIRVHRAQGSLGIEDIVLSYKDGFLTPYVFLEDHVEPLPPIEADGTVRIEEARIAEGIFNLKLQTKKGPAYYFIDRGMLFEIGTFSGDVQWLQDKRGICVRGDERDTLTLYALADGGVARIPLQNVRWNEVNNRITVNKNGIQLQDGEDLRYFLFENGRAIELNETLASDDKARFFDYILATDTQLFILNNGRTYKLDGSFKSVSPEWNSSRKSLKIIADHYWMYFVFLNDAIHELFKIRSYEVVKRVEFNHTSLRVLLTSGKLVVVNLFESEPLTSLILENVSDFDQLENGDLVVRRMMNGNSLFSKYSSPSFPLNDDERHYLPSVISERLEAKYKEVKTALRAAGLGLYESWASGVDALLDRPYARYYATDEISENADDALDLLSAFFHWNILWPEYALLELLFDSVRKSRSPKHKDLAMDQLYYFLGSRFYERLVDRARMALDAINEMAPPIRLRNAVQKPFLELRRHIAPNAPEASYDGTFAESVAETGDWELFNRLDLHYLGIDTAGHKIFFSSASSDIIYALDLRTGQRKEYRVSLRDIRQLKVLEPAREIYARGGSSTIFDAEHLSFRRSFDTFAPDRIFSRNGRYAVHLDGRVLDIVSNKLVGSFDLTANRNSGVPALRQLSDYGNRALFQKINMPMGNFTFSVQNIGQTNPLYTTSVGQNSDSAISRDGRKLAVLTIVLSKLNLIVTDLDDGNKSTLIHLTTLPAPLEADIPKRIAFSSDGRMVAVRWEDRLYVCDTVTAKVVSEQETIWGQDTLFFADDDRILVVGQKNEALLFYKVPDSARHNFIDHPLLTQPGTYEAAYKAGWAGTPDPEMMTREERRNIEIWFAPDYEFFDSLRWDFWENHKIKTTARALGAMFIIAATAAPAIFAHFLPLPPQLLEFVLIYLWGSLITAIIIAHMIPDPRDRQLPWGMKLILVPVYLPNVIAHALWNKFFAGSALTLAMGGEEFRQLLLNTPFVQGKENELTASPEIKHEVPAPIWWEPRQSLLFTHDDNKKTFAIYSFENKRLKRIASFNKAGNYRISHEGLYFEINSSGGGWTSSYLVGNDRELIPLKKYRSNAAPLQPHPDIFALKEGNRIRVYGVRDGRVETYPPIENAIFFFSWSIDNPSMLQLVGLKNTRFFHISDSRLIEVGEFENKKIKRFGNYLFAVYSSDKTDVTLYISGNDGFSTFRPKDVHWNNLEDNLVVDRSGEGMTLNGKIYVFENGNAVEIDVARPRRGFFLKHIFMISGEETFLVKNGHVFRFPGVRKIKEFGNSIRHLADAIFTVSHIIRDQLHMVFTLNKVRMFEQHENGDVTVTFENSSSSRYSLPQPQLGPVERHHLPFQISRIVASLYKGIVERLPLKGIGLFAQRDSVDNVKFVSIDSEGDDANEALDMLTMLLQTRALWPSYDFVERLVTVARTTKSDLFKEMTLAQLSFFRGTRFNERLVELARMLLAELDGEDAVERHGGNTIKAGKIFLNALLNEQPDDATTTYEGQFAELVEAAKDWDLVRHIPTTNWAVDTIGHSLYYGHGNSIYELNLRSDETTELGSIGDFVGNTAKVIGHSGEIIVPGVGMSRIYDFKKTPPGKNHVITTPTNFTHDGRYAFNGQTVFDSSTGESTRLFEAPSGMTLRDLSEDGNRGLFFGTEITVWDIGDVSAFFSTARYSNSSSALTRDGRKMAHVYSDKGQIHLQIIDFENANSVVERIIDSKEKKTIQLHNSFFSSDGRMVVVSSYGFKTFYICDVETGKIIKTIDKPNDSVNPTFFADDDRLLALTGTASIFLYKVPVSARHNLMAVGLDPTAPPSGPLGLDQVGGTPPAPAKKRGPDDASDKPVALQPVSSVIEKRARGGARVKKAA